MRLNRALSLCGVASRRKADALIAAGQVRVNGKVVQDFSFDVDIDTDRLSLEGEPLYFKQYDYVILHKPRHVVTTCSDERDRRTVIDMLPEDLAHLKPVGRLDSDSEGLVLLTNDGDLARDLTHPSHGVGKSYIVSIEGDVEDEVLEAIASGVDLEEGRTRPCYIERISTHTHKNKLITKLGIVLREGRNRQIRRMFQAYGFGVERLVRVAIGRLQLGDLELGAWRHLSPQELQRLRQESK
ncbi:MAG: rRNA pseudouridine synthase [Candidatus Obscuribacterales bacterium]|nr:rRNA pseudouridine synthase [Candidatus Obscuribacterales bacterium]